NWRFDASAHNFMGVAGGAAGLADFDNDGRQDVLLSGIDNGLKPVTLLYRQTAEGTFELLESTLEPLAAGHWLLQDFNNDGYTDVLLSGLGQSNQRVAKLYLNQRNSRFATTAMDLPPVKDVLLAAAHLSDDNLPDVFLAGNGLNGKDTAALYVNTGTANFRLLQRVNPLSQGDGLLVDLDGNGAADLLYSGYTNSSYQGYRYNSSGSGFSAPTFFAGMVQGSLTATDFNKDGAPDVFLSGYASGGAAAYLYINSGAVLNMPPDAPSGLMANSQGDSVLLQWQAPADDLTPSHQLSYELYIGAAPETADVLHPQASLQSGERLVLRMGRWLKPEALLRSLPEGTYHWGVQAIDAGYRGSAFVAGGSFTVCYKPDLGPDQALCTGDAFSLQAGADLDVVSWYDVQSGALLQANSNSYSAQLSSSQTIAVEVTKSLGCTLYDTLQLRSVALPISGLAPAYEVCRGEQLSLTAGTGVETVNWYDAAGALILENTATLSLRVEEAQQLMVELINSAGCALQETIQLSPLALPSVSLGADPAVCYSSAQHFSLQEAYPEISWHSARRGLLAENVQQYTYADALEKDTLWVEVVAGNGCVNRDTVIININPLPLALAGEDQIFCQGSTVQIGGAYENTEGLQFYWEPADYLDDARLPNPTVKLRQTTAFYLQVTNEWGCVNGDTVQLVLDNESLIDPGEDRYICLGESTRLGGAPTAGGSVFAYSYEWSPAASLDDPALANPIASPLETTQYRLITRSGSCIIDTSWVAVEVRSLPVTTVSEDITIGAGESTQLTAAGGEAYYWYPNTGLSNFAIANPVASPTQTTLYHVIVTDAWGCSSTDSVKVYVKNDLFIPNLLTPNDDGQNDRFQVYGNGIKEISFSIFDRYGKLFYQTTSVEEALSRGWDGTASGSPAPSGVYVWSLKGVYYDGRPLQFKGASSGTFKLIR
ncbi:MAG: gliding motility-associated C-terminal domain-containing protein, partial [Bacteroidetes bacterium]|nr:gliding motility-associated C-terminal domain-containing protein [Bacteroidota bacterium]